RGVAASGGWAERRGAGVGGGGGGGVDHAAPGSRLGGGAGEPPAERLARLSEGKPAALRKQDVPGGNALHAGLAQARGESLAGFAEPDEAEAGGVAACPVPSPQGGPDPLVENTPRVPHPPRGGPPRPAPFRHP